MDLPGLDGIAGESADAKHKGEIDVLEYDWGLAAPASTRAGGAGAGAGAGKVMFQDLHFVARTSKASPTLFLHCATGKAAKEAVLAVRRAGAKQDDYLVVRLKTVRITSYDQTASGEDDTPLDDVSLAFDRLEVPVIAAVNGPAIGAGCDLACMCDIRIAAESARFAESFVKLGIVPGDGGAWLLPRAVGYSKACEMAFTGDTLGAAEALACGLVSKVVPDAELMKEARALAERIAANPPHAVRMTKRLMREGRNVQLATLLELSAAMQSLAHATADHKEAVAAFLEKRKPEFKGG